MRVLITGANGDIGYAILNYFLESNCKVLAIDKNIDRLEIIVNSNLEIYKVDLGDAKKIKNHLDGLEQPFDVMIYAAGIREIVPAIDLSLSQWHSVLDVNLTGAFVISQSITRLAIKSQHPLCIIYISSISGLYGEPERSAYCASKHALIGLSKSLAIELAHSDIRANVIAPGIIETGLTRPYQDNPNVMEQLDCNIPLRRWGKPHHIVKAIDFIIKNDYVTGSTLVVDGGWTAGKKL